jgi:hypothetical protein
MKSLPARPSLESLRKQAKKLARDVAAGDAAAIARAHVYLPDAKPPLTQRNAQLVIAREYGFAGWQDLTEEGAKRLGTAIDWAAKQAKRAIHDNDVERLKQLLAEHPALLSWQDDENHTLLTFATGAYGDAGDPERERWFTRGECAELLIDADVVVTPLVCEGILQSRARGLLQLFYRKGLLPHRLEFSAALGDLDAVRASLHESGNDAALVDEAFVRACAFSHEAVASLLLEESIALDPELGDKIDNSVGRPAFVKYFIETRPEIVREIAGHATTIGLWKAFIMQQVSRAAQDGDVTAFVSALQREPWLLDDARVDFQSELIGAATLNGRGEIITALLDGDPAILRRQPPPPSQAIEFALTYAQTHLVPLLTRIWPVPDDLPHSAGMGNLSRVKRWFDESGAPALGDLDDHYPCNDARARGHLDWEPPSLQHVLDVALAFSVINRHFDVADFLLAHGADVNTNWNSHEPASILHHLVFLPDSYESMQFLIDRGIDMTIEDYRWNSDARGWALYGLKDERMAQWLEDAERRRRTRSNEA